MLNKKENHILVIIVIIVLLLSNLTIHATEYHVAKNGNDKNPGSNKLPFLTIQIAANITQPGDTITVHGGIYRE